MKKILAASTAAMMLSACATQTFHMNDSNGRLSDEDMQSFFISGVGQEQETDAAKACGGVSKVAKVQTEQTFLDGLVGFITFGIYTPRTARVFCTR